ncbi:MAG: DUF4249 domain-containing protein [Bacteroidota bacterium]
MKKLKFLSLVFLPAILGFLGSCEQTLTLDFPEVTPQMAVYGFIQTEGPIEIFLNRSFPEDFEAQSNFEQLQILDAEVEVFENGESIGTMVYTDTTLDVIRNIPVFTPNSISRRFDTTTTTLGKYLLPDHTAQAGHTYEIRVSHPDFPLVSAQTTILHPSTFTIPTLAFNASNEIEVVELETELVSRSFATVSIQDDPRQAHFYTMGGSYIAFEDDTADYVLRRPLEVLGPTASGSGSSLLVEESWLSDNDWNGETKTAEFIFETPSPIVETDTLRQLTITLYSANVEMWRYLNSFRTQQRSQESIFTDIFPSEPVTLLSNVENGIGVFGCLNQDTFVVPVEP